MDETQIALLTIALIGVVAGFVWFVYLTFSVRSELRHYEERAKLMRRYLERRRRED